MGAWGQGYFDDDTASDFVDEVLKKGFPALKATLATQLPKGIARANQATAPSEIEAKVQIQLEKHRQMQARGLSVGPLDEAERIWRETFELDSKERAVWEVYAFAAAVMVLKQVKEPQSDFPDELGLWVVKSAPKLAREWPRLLAFAVESWECAKANIALVSSTLSMTGHEVWVADISQILDELV